MKTYFLQSPNGVLISYSGITWKVHGILKDLMPADLLVSVYYYHHWYQDQTTDNRKWDNLFSMFCVDHEKGAEKSLKRLNTRQHGCNWTLINVL